jgi:hypothetical protein
MWPDCLLISDYKKYSKAVNHFVAYYDIAGGRGAKSDKENDGSKNAIKKPRDIYAILKEIAG